LGQRAKGILKSASLPLKECDTVDVRAYEEVVEFIAACNPREVVGFNPSEAARQRVWNLIERQKVTGLSAEDKAELFHEFIFPALKAECQAAHAKGKYFIKHTDGKLWLVLDQMIEAGIDGWQGIQPEIGMTLPALQERYGGRLCFWGGVSMPALIQGTEEQLAEEVRVACASAPAAGGLVITCGNSVMVGVKYQNYLAQLRAARLYGQRGAGTPAVGGCATTPLVGAKRLECGSLLPLSVRPEPKAPASRRTPNASRGRRRAAIPG